MKKNKEEEFLIKILFNNLQINKEILNKINLGNLIKVTSSHLMLPCLFHNLKIRNQVNLFPKDFTDYINEIFEINRNRNLLLVNEIRELNEIMNSVKLDFVFLKGSAMIIRKLYSDIGIRMIGDIDFLVNEKQIELTKDILKK